MLLSRSKTGGDAGGPADPCVAGGDDGGGRDVAWPVGDGMPVGQTGARFEENDVFV